MVDKDKLLNKLPCGERWFVCQNEGEEVYSGTERCNTCDDRLLAFFKEPLIKPECEGGVCSL